MKLRSRLQRSPEVPTSSMADIAFLLIIFFMLTAVFTSNRGLQFAFPKEDPTRLDVQPEEAVHIKITGEATVPGGQNAHVAGRRMASYVEAKMGQNPSKPVIIQTQGHVPYRVMIEVFDVLRQLEVKNISVPTESEVERWKTFGVFE